MSATEQDFSFHTTNLGTGQRVKHVFDTYEELVAAKRQRNADMLTSSGLLEAAESLKHEGMKATQSKPSQRGISKRKISTRARSLPPRKSSRLQGKQAEPMYIETESGGRITTSGGTPSFAVSSLNKDATAETTVNEGFFNGRVNDGSPLSVSEAIGLIDTKWKGADDRETQQFMSSLELPPPIEFEDGMNDGIVSSPTSTVLKQMSTRGSRRAVNKANPTNGGSTLASQIQHLKVDNEEDVAKVTPDRIYSIACHPSTNTNNLIVCAGDKRGNLGLWNVDAGRNSYSSGSDGVHLFKPHGGAISHLEWNSAGSSLFSISYDGSVREFDVEKQVFSEVFATYDDSDEYKGRAGFDIDEGYRFWVQHGILDHRNEKCMFLSTSVGSVLHLDLRLNNSVTFNQMGLSDKKINTVHLHPNGQTLATCGLDNTVKLWDVRTFSTNKKSAPKPFAYQACSRSINSAFFSPSGKKLVTTTMADTLDISSDSHLQSGMFRPSNIIRHNNKTGRWISTLMARWHPTSDEELFVVGCMKQPRQIEVFDGGSGKLIRGVHGGALTAVASRCCFHPRVDVPVIAGGNSSGRVTILRCP